MCSFIYGNQRSEECLLAWRGKQKPDTLVNSAVWESASNGLIHWTFTMQFVCFCGMIRSIISANTANVVLEYRVRIPTLMVGLHLDCRAAWKKNRKSVDNISNNGGATGK